MRKGPPLIRMALLFAVLLASLTLVVWRQSRALALLRELETVRAERVLEEARRASLARRADELGSRGRVSSLAREQLGMRLPTGAEIVILSLRPASGALQVGASRPSEHARRAQRRALPEQARPTPVSGHGDG